MYTKPIFLATLFLIQSLTYFRLIPVTHNPSTNASLTDSILRDGILFSSRDASPAFNCSPAGLFILIFRRGTGDTESHLRTFIKSIFIFKHRTGDSDPNFNTVIKSDFFFKHRTGDTDSPDSHFNTFIKSDLIFKHRTGDTDSHLNTFIKYVSIFKHRTGVTDSHFKTSIISDFIFKHRTGVTDSHFKTFIKSDFNFRQRTSATDPLLKTGSRTQNCFPFSNCTFRRRTDTDPTFKTFIKSRSRTHNCSSLLNIRRCTYTTSHLKTLTKSRLFKLCLLDSHPVAFTRIRLEAYFNYVNYANKVQTNNDNLFFLDSEDGSGSEQEAAPRAYTREEEEDLLKSDSDDMDVDGESFHSARSESPQQQDKHSISRVYKTVRAAKLAAMTCRSLSTAGTRPLSPVGSFVNPKDGRGTPAPSTSTASLRAETYRPPLTWRVSSA